MSQDCHLTILHEIENKLAYLIPSDQLSIISDAIVMELGKYDIVKKCTDLTVYDSSNTKILNRYCACLLVDGKSEKTIYQYNRTAKMIGNMLGKKYTDMTPYDIRYFLALEKERGISNRSLENTRANLSAFFQWMSDEEIISKNPLSSIKPIKFVDEIRKPFSDVEIDAMRSACKNIRERALIEFLLSTGVRVSELSSMMINDVNFNELSVHVRHGKGGKERIAYTTPIGIKYLNEYLMSRNDNLPFLFCNKDTKQLNPGGIRYILNKLTKSSGVINIHPHRFRRTFASSASKRGLKVEEIQKLLGHSDINTTMQYVYIDNDDIKISYRHFVI